MSEDELINKLEKILEDIQEEDYTWAEDSLSSLYNGA